MCQAPHDYAPAWQGCQRAFKLADRFARSGVVYEGDFGPYGLVFSALPSSQVDAFVANALRPLDQYDAQHRGDLLSTLEGYLAAGGKLQKCADELKVHVTTLRYRLERIQEVSGKDLDDAEVRFSFELAFRLRRLQHI
jgi:DNA-binding PucR family transcriptional regulator